MAGIKIVDLPPNSLPLVGDELLELENADGNSTRATVADIASAAAGLDATFITVSANAALPNERVLTAGTNISLVDGGPNSTITINAAGVSFPLLAPDGSAVAPSYSFTNDTGAGMFLNALGELSFAADGVEILRAINGVNNQVAIAQSGSTSVPDLTSLADLDTGFRFPANNETVWMGGGSRSWNFSTAKFYSQFSNGPALMNEISSDTNPTLVPDHSDPNTGIGHPSASDELSIIAGGVEAVRVDETAGAIQVIIDPGLTNTSDATPPLAFGGGTVGFRSPDSDQIFAILSGTSTWHFTTQDFHANFTDGPALRKVTPSGIIPSLLPNFNDTDTGVGTAGPDVVDLIAGAIQAVEYAEVSSHIVQTNENHTGLVASVTQTQAGGLVLLSSYNEVATVVNPGDALTAFAVVPGHRLLVLNNGVSDLQLFPAIGDDFGAGIDTAITISVGHVGIFIGRDGTNWDVLFNSDPTPGGLTFPLLAPDGSAVAPSYSFSADTDIGMFRVGADILGLAARSVTIAQAVGVLGANQFVVAPGAIQNNQSAPDIGLGDGDTGIMQTVDNTLAIIAGANQAVRYAEASASIIQTNASDVGLTASVTQTQAGGLVLLSSYNEISIVATTGDALTAMDVFQGHRLIVVNNGANDLQLFPAVGDDFGAGVDAAITIAVGSVGVFLGRDSINWDVLFNNGPSGLSFPLLAPDGTAGAPSYSFSGDTDMGIFRLGGFLAFTVGGTAQFGIDGTSFSAIVAGGPLIRNLAASSTVPNITISSSDIDTGLGTAGADRLSLIAGGLEGIQVFETGAAITVFTRGTVVGTGGFRTDQVGGGSLPDVNATSVIPSLLPNQGDANTGIGYGGGGPSDSISIIAGGVDGFRLTEASSRIIQKNDNHVALTASVTQTQAGGLALLSSYNEVATVANVGDALTAFAAVEGNRLVVVNNGANSLQLFPALGDNFGAGVNTSLVIDSGSVGVFIGRDVTNWDTLFLGDPDGISPGGASVSGRWSFDSSTVEADPGAGNFRNDNATIGSVTEVFISSETEDGIDADNILSFLGSGDQLYIQNIENAAEFLLFSITANVDNTGWFSLAGTVAASGSNFTNGAEFGILLLFGGTGGASVQVPNDAVQARRTTSFTLTTAFVDVTLDTTDIETDSAVLNHDLITNTDNIIVGAAGTYEVTYDFDGATSEVAGDDIIDINARVRLNDAGVDLPGSLAIPRMVRDGSIGGANGQWQIHCSNTFIVTVSATDFLTMQLSKTELAGVGVFTCERISIKVRRLL